MQDFSTEFFILLEVLAGSYLVSIIGITCLLAYMYHFVMCIMHSCRYYTVYDIDLVPNLERRGHCDTVRTIDILYVRTFSPLLSQTPGSDMQCDPTLI